MAEDYEEYSKPGKSGKLHNILPLWGNEQTMNLNSLILTNIQGSSYFKVHLFKLKTYHEVVDEIYYQVKHLEPWERGSRKTAGQTGMCGGVRGVGAGGIVSTAFCLLYKLYTLRLTRKQVNGLLTHNDSPFIRALGFMYIRYTQPPAELFDWYEEYLEDAEEVEPRAGGGQPMTIGTLSRHMLTKLDWFSTLFPRIPVPIQKSIEQRYSRDRNNQRERDREPYRGERETHRNEREPPGRELYKNDRDTTSRENRYDRETTRNDHRDSSRRDASNRDNRSRELATSRDNNSHRDPHRRDRSDRDKSDRDRDKSDRDRDRSDQRDRESYRDRSERDKDRDRSKYRERSPRDRRHR